MRVLVVHNYYQHWGGEDKSTEQEAQLLRRHGHEVLVYSRHNDEIREFYWFRKGLLFFEPTWSVRSCRGIERAIRDFHPQIVHIQNCFPLVSPAVIHVCKGLGVPVVHSLRDYRLLCPIGWLYRRNKVCGECVDRSLLRSILHRCYHDSALQTTSVALMLAVHRLLKTWERKVSIFIALSESSRRVFVEAGLPHDRVCVRPNFIERDPGPGHPTRQYALFVGRLSSEKGVATVLDAWRRLPKVPLKILGEGPLRPFAEDFIRTNGLSNVELVGFVRPEQVFSYLKRAYFLLMPSEWYEVFGRTIIEAYACETPVIGSAIGSMVDLIEVEETGLLYEAGDAQALASSVRHAMERPEMLARWGRQARRVFLREYTQEKAHQSLMEIYARVRPQ